MRFPLSFVVLFASAVFAAPLSSLNAISHSEIVAKSGQGLRLISLEEHEIAGSSPVWKTEAEVLDLIQSRVGFFDVTETYEDNAKIAAMQKAAKTTIGTQATWPTVSQQTTVNGVIAKLSTTQMTSYLSTLTAFNNRYYKSTTGASSSDSIFNTLKSITSGRSDISVIQFAHSWVQKSVIVKFAGTSPTSSITILGAHQDSINQSSPTAGRAPGADDDGSGTVNLIDLVRSIVAYGYIPRTPLEFHFYSGEEGGLLGSQAIANSYISAGKSVKAYFNIDMTAYFKPGTTEVIALVTDRVDSTLNTYLRTLISTYLRIGAGTYTCGYACSDHASWNTKGVSASCAYEAQSGNDNPYIHTSSDTTSASGFSWAHSLEFAKLGAAFAVELSA